MTLEIRETYVNETKGWQIGESEWYEPWFSDLAKGKQLRALMSEYGAVASKMYRDTPCGTREVGYVFRKRMEYEDARADWPKDRRTYTRAVWVEFRDLAREEYDHAAKRQQVDIG